MAGYRFSRLAELDLLEIGLYTLRTWGEAQTDRYLSKLEQCCQLLAENPGLGQLCEDVRPGLRRMLEGKHVIFYREEPDAIVVARILHQRMLPEKHDMNDDEQPG